MHGVYMKVKLLRVICLYTMLIVVSYASSSKDFCGFLLVCGNSVKQDFSDESLVFGIASFKNNALYTQQNIVLSQNQENVYTTNNIKPKVKIQGDSLIITDSSCQSQSNKSILSSLKHNVSQSNIVMQEDCERDTKKLVKSKN